MKNVESFRARYIDADVDASITRDEWAGYTGRLMIWAALEEENIEFSQGAPPVDCSISAAVTIGLGSLAANARRRSKCVVTWRSIDCATLWRA